MKASSIAVIGGGIAGLTTAYRLAQAGQQVTLWERSRLLGGQAAAFDADGVALEHFYHHLFQSDVHITGLCDELGIGHRLQWLPSNVGYFSAGQIYPLNGAADLLNLDFLPIQDRLRIGAVTAYLQKVTDWEPFEHVTAESWLRTALGDRAYEATFGAQLEAKFGRHANEIAMVWFWGKIWLRTTSRRSPVEGEKLGYPLGSFNVIVESLVAACKALGVKIVTGTGPEEIRQTESQGLSLEFSDGHGPVQMDAVVATVPSPIIARLAPGLPQIFKARLLSLEYEPAVVALLELDRPLSDVYWLNIADRDSPFTAVIEHTNFVSPSHYGGRRFVYLSRYLEADNPLFTLDDSDLIRTYLPHLSKINPEFDPAWIQNRWVFRERAAQPIITLDYSDRLPDHRTPVDHLYLANTSQIYPEDRGTNYSVRLGSDIAAMVVNDQQSGKPWAELQHAQS